ncbi:secretin N-terminal domain-containing protein [Azotobacter vinelandii]|uniref:secretin N-terminal domain-containing protein n=1 Tax=Azotobacter vinelandii TaxID=354 RepID=UPI0007747775|nr:secretin N-terminal domain-containing protein [Azotobacter vinelandii]
MTIAMRKAAAAFWLPVLLGGVLLSGCAGQPAKEGIALIDQGRYEEGLAQLAEAAHRAPDDTGVQIALATQRALAVSRLLGQAEKARVARDNEAAQVAFQRVLAIEPGNARAAEGMRQIVQLRNVAEHYRQAGLALSRGDLAGAERLVRSILALEPQHEGALALQAGIEGTRAQTAVAYPQLRSRLQQPVSLEFREANLKLVFEVLAQTAGMNFIFDQDVSPDLKATIYVRQVPIEEAVDLLLQQGQLKHKVVNENTVLIYPNTPQKLKDYQELVLKTFYLTNIDANTALNMVKTLLKTRDVFVDERLNTLTMRDTPDAVHLAERLFLAQDQANPEVVLELEVMEVSRKRILDLGLQWPNTFGILAEDGSSAVSILGQLRGIDSDRINFSPSPTLKINANDSDVNTLASPVLRVSNREQARIHIGERVPVVSATSTPSTQGPVITENITYLDVGLKLEVEPTIHLNDEVAIKVGLEVSNATQLTRTEAGTIPIQVDTRNAVTTLRLRNGETQVLAGLMRNDQGKSGDRIPGLGDIPGIGRLFGSNKDTLSKSELVLSITPRIVRNLPYQNPYDMEFESGTESSLRLRPAALPRKAGAALRGQASEPLAAAGLERP